MGFQALNDTCAQNCTPSPPRLRVTSLVTGKNHLHPSITASSSRFITPKVVAKATSLQHQHYHVLVRTMKYYGTNYSESLMEGHWYGRPALLFNFNIYQSCLMQLYNMVVVLSYYPVLQIPTGRLPVILHNIVPFHVFTSSSQDINGTDLPSHPYPWHSCC